MNLKQNQILFLVLAIAVVGLLSLGTIFAIHSNQQSEKNQTSPSQSKKNTREGYSLANASYDGNKKLIGYSSPRGVTFNRDGTKMFVVSPDSSDVYRYDLKEPYKLSTAIFTQKLNIKNQDTGPESLVFNKGGTLMLILGNGNDSIYRYELGTPYDLSKASYSDQSFDISEQIKVSKTLNVSAEGKKMFVAGDNKRIYSYKLGKPYNLNTISYTRSFDVSEQFEGNTIDVTFNPNGTEMFVMGMDFVLFEDDRVNVYRYDLKTPYDLSTASYANDHFEVTGKAKDNPSSFTFNTDGTEMFIIGGQYKDLYRYELKRAYDLSAVRYANDHFDVNGKDGYSTGVTFNSDGTKMFVTGDGYDDIYRYDLDVSYDLSTASYTELFDISGKDGYPTGMVFNTDGTKMFVMGGENDSVYSYNLKMAYKLSTANYVQSFDVSDQTKGSPTDITFNSDGTQMFVVGSKSADIYIYDLKKSYDISTASYRTKIDVSGQDKIPEAVVFNSDGKQMFVLGDSNNSIYRYELGTPYDLSTAKYKNESFDVSSQGPDRPTGITFNSDGTKMFAIGSNFVYRYSTVKK